MSQHRRTQAVHAAKGRVPVKISGYRQAALLGALQGPTELLPVSSSAHLRLVPWLCGWPSGDLDSEQRKAFEVAVHAGAAAATVAAGSAPLLVPDRSRLAVVVLAFVPPAIAGLLFERVIEQRLGGPRSIAVGLIVGAVAMAAADRRPQRRPASSAGPADGLALGFAQAAALAPGISRNGATLAAARRRQFSRSAANDLSRSVALPVIAGAAGLKAARLWRRGTGAELRRSLAVGGASAFAATVVSERVVHRFERARALWPYAAYRIILALVVLRRSAAGSG